jgi:parallel beta-helix repeat protein
VSFRENTIGPDNAIFRNGGPGVCIYDSDNNTVIHNQIYENGENSDACTQPGGIPAGSGVDVLAQCSFLPQGLCAGAFEAKGNTISQNSMWSNFGLGIDLGVDGLGCYGTAKPPAPAPPTPTPSPTPGPLLFNNMANNCNQTPSHAPYGPPAPSYGSSKVSGRINTPDADVLCAFCTVEVFVTDNPPDPTNHGEGFFYLGGVQTDGTGNYSLGLAAIPCGAPAGPLTITVTDRNGNTSEFSTNATVGFPGTAACAPTSTPTPTHTNTPTITNTPVPTTPGPTNTPTHTPTNTNTPANTATHTPTNTATNTPTATVVVTKACGDVNDDGLVDSRDALLILQLKAALITTLTNMASADVNHSGSITAVDAALILQKEAGLIPQSSLHCA